MHSKNCVLSKSSNVALNLINKSLRLIEDNEIKECYECKCSIDLFKTKQYHQNYSKFEMIEYRYKLSNDSNLKFITPQYYDLIEYNSYVFDNFFAHLYLLFQMCEKYNLIFYLNTFESFNNINSRNFVFRNDYFFITMINHFDFGFWSAGKYCINFSFETTTYNNVMSKNIIDDVINDDVKNKFSNCNVNYKFFVQLSQYLIYTLSDVLPTIDNF